MPLNPASRARSIHSRTSCPKSVPALRPIPGSHSPLRSNASRLNARFTPNGAYRLPNSTGSGPKSSSAITARCRPPRSESHAGLGPPQIGRTLPPTKSHCSRSSASAACCSQSGSNRTSSSVVAMISPGAALIPALRAALRPTCRSSRYRSSTGKLAAASATIRCVASVELLSTTITSQVPALVIFARLARVSFSSPARL